MSKKTFISFAALSAFISLGFLSGCGDAESAPTEPSVSEKPTVPVTANCINNTKNTVSATAAVKPTQAAPAVPAKEVPVRILRNRFDSYHREIDFSFAGVVSAEAFEKAISVKPVIPFRVHQYSPSLVSVRADFKPGEVYAVSVPASFAGANTLPIGEAYVATVVTPDLSPVVQFSSAGTFLPLGATHLELPVNLLNISDALSITTREAYEDLLPNFIDSPHSNEYSRCIFEKDVKLNLPRNKTDVFALELEKIGIGRRPGLFSVKINETGSWKRDWCVVVVTDLAVQASRNENELAVVLKNLSGNAAVPNAELVVYSSKNRKIATGKTDANGFASIYLPTLSDKEDSPNLLIAKSGNDTTFLNLNTLRVSRSGDAKLLDTDTRAHVFAERGICRPGEKIRIFASLRDAETLVAEAGVPAEFAVTDPRGNAFVRIPAVGDNYGFYKAEVAIPTFATTGTYDVKLRLPGQDTHTFGTSAFRVAEYVPDTFSVGVKSVFDDSKMTVRGNATYYFGAPLSAGKVRAEREIEAGKFLPKNADGFTFGLPSAFADAFYGFGRTGKAANSETDANGDFSVEFEHPVFDKTPVSVPVNVYVTASVSGEHGGRSVSAGTRGTIHYADFYLGTREASVSADTRTYALKALSPDEKPCDLSGKKFRAELFREEWNYVLRERSGGVLSYDWQKNEILENTIEFDGGAETLSVPIPVCGNYTLKISDVAGGLVHMRDFWHYSGEAGVRSPNSTNLVFSLDRENYLPGETAKISFDSMISGKANVVFGAEKIEGMFPFDVKIGKNVFELPVPAATVRGCRFFAVTVVGKRSEEMQRLFGVGSVAVNQQARKIFVKTEVPSVARPGEKVIAKVALSDAAGNPVSGRVQLWAVDRGVLALTGFSTPDAYSYFFGHYGCPYAFGDSYDDFYPLLSVDKKLIGGGKGASMLRKFLDEQSDAEEHSAVVVADVLDVPESGEAFVELSLPNFDGGMRLMAFALNAEKLGSGEAEFAVRERVSAKMTAPRAVAPGDEFEILAEVFNTEMPEQNFAWTLSLGGKVLKSGKTETVKTGGKFALKERVVCDANALGNLNFELKVFDANGAVCLTENVAMVARTPVAAQDMVRVVKVAPGTEATFENADEFGNVSIGSPALAIVGAMTWLNEYPYGCLEQTAATAFPFLGVKRLTQEGILPEVLAEGAATQIRSALAQISTMQLARGDYAMWPNSKNAWENGTLFAYHFLLEADAAGFALPEAQRKKMQNVLADYFGSRSRKPAFRAYAAYLSALSGDRRAVNFARLVLLEKSDDFSKFLAGAALVHAGFAAEGMETITPILEKRFWMSAPGDFGCLDSPERRAGMTLCVLCEVAPDSPATAQIAAELCRMMNPQGHWGSTQKNAWVSLGLSAFLHKSGNGVERGVVEIGGNAQPLEGAMVVPGGNAVRVKNTGDREILVFVRTREKPKAFESVSSGFEISRHFFNAQGEVVTECESGDLLTVKIYARTNEYTESAVICDLLPGGLEIEDETLLTRSRVRNASSGDAQASSAFSEMVRERRFDRFLAFGAFSASEEWSEITYRVRATARGTFAVPPVQVESMYEGEKRAAWCPENPVFIVK